MQPVNRLNRLKEVQETSFCYVSNLNQNDNSIWWSVKVGSELLETKSYCLKTIEFLGWKKSFFHPRNFGNKQQREDSTVFWEPVNDAQIKVNDVSNQIFSQ